MKLNEEMMYAAEEFSNHAVQCFATTECPKPEKAPCFCIATGFGGAPVSRCDYITDDGDCLYAAQ